MDMAPTPATQGGPVPGVPVPDGALNSDDNNSFISLDTESEGDFGLNHLWWWFVDTLPCAISQLAHGCRL